MIQSIPRPGGHRAVLPFLGSRRYLHGTTLYQEMTKHVPEDAAVDFRIAQVIPSNCVELVTRENGDTRRGAASLDWKRVSETGSVYVVPCEPCELTINKYDEQAVVNRSQVTREAVEYNGGLYPLVPTLIPMFKQMLLVGGHQYPGGQWMFTRFSAIKPDAPFERVALKLTHVRREMLGAAEVLVDGAHFGQIMFSWVLAQNVPANSAQ